MPPTNQPTRRKILDAIQAYFAGMTADGYFYPPDLCRKMRPPLLQYLKSFKPEERTVYGFWVETEDITEQTSGQVQHNLRVFVQGATRYAPQVVNPFRQAEAGQDDEEEVRTRLIHDAEKVIENSSFALSGNQGGGLWENWEQIGNDAHEMNFIEIPGWVAFEMETNVSYFTRLGDPTIPQPTP